jgi:hypothetical protein
MRRPHAPRGGTVREIADRVLRHPAGTQRHKAAQLSVLSLVDDSHASAAKFFNNAVVGNRTAYEGQGIRHGWRTS